MPPGLYMAVPREPHSAGELPYIKCGLFVWAVSLIPLRISSPQKFTPWIWSFFSLITYQVAEWNSGSGWKLGGHLSCWLALYQPGWYSAAFLLMLFFWYELLVRSRHIERMWQGVRRLVMILHFVPWLLLTTSCSETGGRRTPSGAISGHWRLSHTEAEIPEFRNCLRHRSYHILLI